MARTQKVVAPATTQGKVKALEALEERRKLNKRRKQIDNASLPAGSFMYFYCIACGDLSDTKPECYTDAPKRLCRECEALKDLGWLE